MPSVVADVYDETSVYDKLRSVPDYVLILPQLTQDDTDKDIKSFDKRISDAKAPGSKFAKSKPGALTATPITESFKRAAFSPGFNSS
mmetsp:Transcript_69592/g.122800  ORF Transcript_69592/g.122800 Transcript_69592/m.122800 type:complete len:87 (+) Transcript_69592:637-897(+)